MLPQTPPQMPVSRPTGEVSVPPRPPMGQAGAPAGAEASMPNENQIRQAILAAAQELKQVAEKYGIDLVAELQKM